MTFHVGQKVVRIKVPEIPFNPTWAEDIGERTEVGVIYEVRWVGSYSFAQPEGPAEELPACKVVGVMRRTKSKDGTIRDDIPWGQNLFRPLQEEKKEEKASAAMDIFRRIAANPQIPIKEDA